MNINKSRSDAIATVVVVAVHGVLWFILCMCVLIMAPRVERTYRDFDMKLPALTESVLELSHWMAAYYYVLPILALPFILLDAAVFWLCRSSPQLRILSVLWAIFMFLILLTAFALLTVSLLLPGAKLAESLQK
jgi:type II secretory pathway component PulF